MVGSRVVAPVAAVVADGVVRGGGRTPGPAGAPAGKFTEADARILVSFAQSSHLGRLGFGSVDRDQACGGSAGGGAASGLPECSETSQSPLGFTKIFTAYTG
jgi:hypothetical protein